MVGIPAGAARVGLVRRAISLVVGVLMVAAAVVVELSTLALVVPATASADPSAVTAYVTNFFGNSVTPIAVATTLAVGIHSLSAVFTPTNPVAFGPAPHPQSPSPSNACSKRPTPWQTDTVADQHRGRPTPCCG